MATGRRWGRKHDLVGEDPTRGTALLAGLRG